MSLAKKSLGENLVEAGMLTQAQLSQAQAEEKKTGQRLRKVLVKMGLIREADLVAFLSEKMGIPRIELSNYIIDPKTAELIPESLARKYELIPVLRIGNRLTCVMVDPWNIFALDEVRMKTGFTVEPAVATESEIHKVIGQYYGAKGSIEDLIKTIEEQKPGLEVRKELDVKTLQSIAEEPLVVKLVNLTIMKAVKDGASDIHLEPEENALRTRFRIDGMLHDQPTPPKYLQSAIISRIKIMANLDIAERRMPQDGRFTIMAEGRQVDMRVSCIPTIHGENVVLRLLDPTSALLTLEQLGFSKQALERFNKLIVRPHGIILVTGPTGSGKTTTLYASLARINTEEKNIITIEDPVEYKIPGVRQMQVNAKVDLTFANGLRSMLRQDPDIIMVGEIRDFEAAEIAIQAALTGHLVFSTLHTNDAPSAITRCTDMGVEPFLLSSCLIGVLAQRLVRKICPECKSHYTPTKEQLRDICMSETEQIEFFEGNGCPACLNTGYKGRISIYELMVPDENIRNAIVAKASADELRKLARSAGMKTLMEDGLEKIKAGITSVEEVLRVTREE